MLLTALAMIAAIWGQDAPADSSSVYGVLPGMPLPIACDGNLEALTRDLALSDEQSTACRSALQQYWTTWRGVQQLEFATFAPQQIKVASIWWNGPDRATLDAFAVQSQRVEASLKAADQGFWEAVAAILTPEQTPRIERQCAKREREYFASDPVVQAWFPGGAPLDLHDLIAECAPNELEATADAVRAYDARTLELLRKLRAAIADARSCWVKGTEGMAKQSVDPNAPMQVLVQNQDLIHPWSDCLQPVRQVAVDCLHLTRDTMMQAASSLPQDQRRMLEAMYFARQFGDMFIMCVYIEDVLIAAANAPDVDAAARARIIAARDRWFKEARPLQWAAVEGQISRRITMLEGLHVSMGMPAAGWQDATVAVDRLRHEVDQVIQQALPRIASREISNRVFKERVEPLRKTDQLRLDERKRGQVGGVQLTGSSVPAPFTLAEIERIAAATSSNVSTPALTAALEEYAPEFQRLLEALRPASSAPAGLPSRSSLAPTRQRLEAHAVLSKRLDALDVDLIASIGQPTVEALLQVHRVTSQAIAAQKTVVPDAIGLPVDFTNLVEAIDDPRERAAVVAILTERHTELFAQMNEHRVALQRLHDARELAAAARVLRPDDQSQPGAWDAVRQQVQDCEDGLRKATDDVAEVRSRMLALERHVAATMIDAVEPNTGRATAQAFAEQAFPDVLGDIGSARVRLNRALKAPQIAPQQRDALFEWAIAFSGRCDERLQDAITLLWSLALAPVPDQVGTAVRELQIEQMRIDQRQLAGEVEAILRRTLSPDQLAAIGFSAADR